jgi:hypothetical protein
MSDDPASIEAWQQQMSDDIVERLRYKLPLYATYSGMTVDLKQAIEEIERLRAERDEARRYSCDLEARIIMLEEDRRDTSNNFGTNPCSEIILPDYPLARDPKEIAKRKGWDCYKEETK